MILFRLSSATMFYAFAIVVCITEVWLVPVI